jgi:hypothetical protein
VPVTLSAEIRLRVSSVATSPLRGMFALILYSCSRCAGTTSAQPLVPGGNSGLAGRAMP